MVISASVRPLRKASARIRASASVMLMPRRAATIPMAWCVEDQWDRMTSAGSQTGGALPVSSSVSVESRPFDHGVGDVPALLYRAVVQAAPVVPQQIHGAERLVAQRQREGEDGSDVLEPFVHARAEEGPAAEVA